MYDEDSPPLECKYNKCDFEFEPGIFGVAGCPCRTASPWLLRVPVPPAPSLSVGHVVCYVPLVLNSASKSFYLPIFHCVGEWLPHCESRTPPAASTSFRSPSSCPALTLLMVLVFGLFNGVLFYYLFLH